MWSMVSAMVKANATPQCGPGLNLGPGVINWLSLLLVLDDPTFVKLNLRFSMFMHFSLHASLSPNL